MKNVKIVAMVGLRKKITNYWGQTTTRIFKNWVLFLTLISCLLCLVNFLVFAPGFYTFDSIEQLSQVVGKEQLSNWHPVAFVLVWKTLMGATGYISSMLLLQLFLVWSGLLIFAISVYRITGSRRSSFLTLLIGLSPFIYAISSTLLKDVHLAHALFVAIAVLIYAYSSSHRPVSEYTDSQKIVLFCLVGVLLVYAATMRHGAMVAFLPILFLLTNLLFKSRKNVYLVAVCLFFILILIPGLVDKSTPSEKVYLEYSVFVDDFVFVASADDIKQSTMSDSNKKYLLRVKAGCPARSTRISGSIIHCKEAHKKTYYQDFKDFAASDINGSIKETWVRIILKHPFSYIKYRTVSFIKLLFAEVPDVPWRPPTVSNDYGLNRQTGITFSFLANVYSFTLKNFGFVFRGWFWLTLNLLTLFYALYRRKDLAFFPLITGIASSGILYALQFFPVVMAYGYRYLYWVTLSGILCAVLLVLDLNRREVKKIGKKSKTTKHKRVAAQR